LDPPLAGKQERLEQYPLRYAEAYGRNYDAIPKDGIVVLVLAIKTG
jgi:hypothetical protein